jgi:rRNA maturation endonuclease Nob1
MDDPDMQDFYRDVQKRSVVKRCQGCGRKVKILPEYGYCDSCATKREQGWDI